MAQRDRKESCRQKIIAYFKDDNFHQFLDQKYAGHNGAGNWWKEVGLALDHMVKEVGREAFTVDRAKKAFSDAIFLLDAQAGKNLDLLLSAKHMVWLKAQKAPGLVKVEEYAKCGYQPGVDGMIERLPPRKRERDKSLSDGAEGSDDRQEKQARTSSPQNRSVNDASSGTSNALKSTPDPNMNTTATLQDVLGIYATAPLGWGHMALHAQMASFPRDESSGNMVSQQFNRSSHDTIGLTGSSPSSDIVDLTQSPTK